MKRSGPIQRKTPLKAGEKPLVRRARLAPVNPRRKQDRMLKQYGGAYALFIRFLACVVPGCDRTDVEAAHAKSRGAGGDWRSLFPCCHAHHVEQHTLGLLTWQKKYGLDVNAVAAELVQEYGRRAA